MENNGKETGKETGGSQLAPAPRLSAAAAAEEAAFGALAQETRGTPNIWKSRISRRITLAAFVTIFLVQMSVLAVTVRNTERDLLANLTRTAESSLLSVLETSSGPLSAPLSAAAAQRVITHTIVDGITVFGLDHGVIQVYGAPTILTPRALAEGDSWRSEDGRRYEIILTPATLGRPYYMTVTLDASSVEPAVLDYVRQNIIILVLLSGFVTSVLMLALGQWLLEPIMVLRGNLLSAAQNPEKPELKRARNENRDEIGVAIRIANDLIRQNAGNLRRLRAQAEDKIHKLAYYDSLTGLPNRTFFLEKLDEAIRTRVMGEDRRLAVMSVDIDHFKDVNDSMGHEVGDRLLEAIGKRLTKALPEDALIARTSADEFVVMAMMTPESPDSQALVDRVFAAMAEPVSIMQERFQIRVSIGVAHCPEDGTEARQTLKNADIALNRAKEEGRDTVRYYSQDFDRAVQARFQMLRDLRTALDENQLQLHYHPQFDLKTGAIVGAEALLRWWKPDNSREGGQFIPPSEFIPVAEQSGLIVPLGEWVLRTACTANKEWQKRGLPPMRVAVNISGVQFHRADIVNLVSSVLRETKLGPQFLELEITESVFMENTQVAINILDQLHSLGVEISVDDFGTGYSSLSYLRRFPIDRIKIDQSFTRNALNNQDDATIARTIINLGHSLGLRVVAEGVETSDHEEFLKREGCDEAQGFKYTKPIPGDKLYEFCLNYHRNLAKGAKLSVIDGGDGGAA